MDYEVYRNYKLKVNPFRYISGGLIGIAVLLLLFSIRSSGSPEIIIDNPVTENEAALVTVTQLLTNAEKSLGGDQLNSDLQFKIAEYEIVRRPVPNKYIVLLIDEAGNQRCQTLTLVEGSRLEPAEILDIENCVK